LIESCKKKINTYIKKRMATDAFGRLRIADAFTTFHYYPSSISTDAISGIDQNKWVTTKGGSSAADFDTTNAFIYLRCTADGDKVTRETKLPMEYQPGKSRLIYI
jgi:hypothetical protein